MSAIDAGRTAAQELNSIQNSVYATALERGKTTIANLFGRHPASVPVTALADVEAAGEWSYIIIDGHEQRRMKGIGTAEGLKECSRLPAALKKLVEMASKEQF